MIIHYFSSSVLFGSDGDDSVVSELNSFNINIETKQAEREESWIVVEVRKSKVKPYHPLTA
jgi:hypothetical protein